MEDPNRHIQNFLKAVAFGTLAGAALPVLFTSVLALFLLYDVANGTMSFWQVTYLMILPLLVTFPIVFISSLFFGLPIVLSLRVFGYENAKTYGGLGLILGAAATLFGLSLMDARSGYWMAFLGGFAGFVTAITWWAAERGVPFWKPFPPIEQDVGF